MSNNSIDDFKVLSPSEKKELERKRQEQERKRLEAAEKARLAAEERAKKAKVAAKARAAKAKEKQAIVRTKKILCIVAGIVLTALIAWLAIWLWGLFVEFDIAILCLLIPIVAIIAIVIIWVIVKVAVEEINSKQQH